MSHSFNIHGLGATASPEAGAWDGVRHGWRHLYGGILSRGVSVELHQFRCQERLDWARSFHPESVELCLNVLGWGKMMAGPEEVVWAPNHAGFYVIEKTPLQAWREPGDHFFVTIELRPDFFRQQSAYDPMQLQSELRLWLNGVRPPRPWGALREMSVAEAELVKSLTNPPVAESCRALWYQGKIMELMAHFLFCAPKSEDFFCSRQKQAMQNRVEWAATLLRQNLENPPALEELGRHVGVSSYYLSRIFSEQKGMTLTQFLKRARIEKATELLRTGTCNVTEAAMAVGYSSLSHFSRAFGEIHGCSPTDFLKNAGASV